MGSLSSPPPSPHPPENPAATRSRIICSFSRLAAAAGTTVPNWLDSYNPDDNTWDHIGPILGIPSSHVLKGFALVAVRESIYVIGGRLCLQTPLAGPEDFAERDVAVRRDVLRYNVAAGEWSACAPLALPRFDFACTPCGGRIFVAGGRCGTACARGTSAAEVYDPTEDRWAPLPAMGAARYRCVGVAWQGRFHVVGGFAEREGSGGPTVVERSSAEVFDEGQGRWELVPGMWQLDVPPNQIVAVDGRLFSSGDCLNSWKGHIETYDGGLNIWNVIERSQLYDLSSLVGGAAGEERDHALERLYLSMAPVEGRFYFLAGYRVRGEEGRSMAVVHAFDRGAPGAAEAWESFPPFLEEGEKQMCSHCCVVQLWGQSSN